MRKTINQELAVSQDIHCKKLTWMLLNKGNELDNIEVSLTTLEGRQDVEKAAAKMFAERNILHLDYKTPFAMMCVETEEAIDNGVKEYINGASFAVEDLICRPQYIRVYDKKTIGLFVIHMCLEGEENEDGSKKGKDAVRFMEDVSKLSFQRYVLKKLGYHVQTCTIYYVNKQYVKTSSRHTWSEFLISEDVTQNVIEHEIHTEVAIREIREMMNTREEPKCESLNETRCINTPCPCFTRCKKEKGVEDSILWKIAGLWKSKKCLLANNGCSSAMSILDACYSGLISLNEKQRRQLEYHINDIRDPYMEEEALKDYMAKTFEGKRVIVFFDFESYMYILPKFKDLQPYTQLPFQWSAHVLDVERMEIKHYEFLGQKGKDPRRACIDRILELPHGDDVVWLAYNMGFEKGVFRKLAEYSPEDEDVLMYIRESFRDLMTPFQKHWFYTNDFCGSYSIKYVLPGLFPGSESLNYKNLVDIQNGTDAQRGYLQMQKKKGIELRELKKNMLAYCKLDTWAMVMVYSYLVNLVESNFNQTSFSENEIKEQYIVA